MMREYLRAERAQTDSLSYVRTLSIVHIEMAVLVENGGTGQVEEIYQGYVLGYNYRSSQLMTSSQL